MSSTTRWGLSESEVDSLEKMKLLIYLHLPELEHTTNSPIQYEKNNTFSDISSERVFVRFLKGNSMNHKLAAAAYIKYLSWRKEMNVNQIRNNILKGDNMTNPASFPYSSIISKFLYQSALAPAVVDKSNRPIFLSQFVNFQSPLFQETPSDQQLSAYLIHWFEYRSLLLDQLSEASEQDQKESTNVLLQTCHLWDLKEFFWKHLADPTITRFMSLYFEMSFAYYPEQIGRIHIVNAHWSWVKLWGWMKGSFNETSIRKMVLHKKSSVEFLLSEMSLESIPPHLGGCLLNDDDSNVSDFTSLIQNYIFVMRKNITRSSSPLPHPLNGISDTSIEGTPKKSARTRFFGLSSSRKSTPRSARAVVNTSVSTPTSVSEPVSIPNPLKLSRSVSDGTTQSSILPIIVPIPVIGSPTVLTTTESGSNSSSAISDTLLLTRSDSEPISGIGSSDKKSSRLISGLSSLAKSTSFRLYRERREKEEQSRDATTETGKVTNPSLLRQSNDSSLVASGDCSPASQKYPTIPGLLLPQIEGKLSPGNDSKEEILKGLTEEETMKMIKSAKSPRGILKRSIFLRFLLLFMRNNSSIVSSSIQSSSTTIINPSVSNAKYWLYLLSIFSMLVSIRKIIYFSIFILIVGLLSVTENWALFIKQISQYLSSLK